MEIEYTASSNASSAISRLGRTEDVQFSPDGRRLAVAAFNESRLLILEIEADWNSNPPKVALGNPLEIESDDLRKPHGVSWIDDRTIAVANRIGQLAIFELPEKTGRIRLSPVRALGEESSELLATPGSVSARMIGLDLIELVVCNNYVHHVSRHLVDRRDNYSLIASEVLSYEDLAVPDGVAFCPSGRWMAISNHAHNNVVIFQNDEELGPRTRPNAVLNGLKYPHGLRFAENGKTLLVADAGAPFVQIYRSADGEWAGELEPDTSVRVFSDEVYVRGRTEPAVGGPKGVDLAHDGRLMAISCEEEPFAFFDMGDFFDQLETPRPSNLSEAETVRKTLLRYVSSEQAKIEAATSAIRRASDLELGRVTRSRSWRLTAPLRWGTAALRRKAPGWSAKYL